MSVKTKTAVVRPAVFSGGLLVAVANAGIASNIGPRRSPFQVGPARHAAGGPVNLRQAPARRAEVAASGHAESVTPGSSAV